MTAPDIPLAAGPGGGDITRVTLVRFARAAKGPAKLRAPALDDRGFEVDLADGAFRPARGPTVGMTLGGPAIRVRVVRELLPARVPLFVSIRHVSGDAHPLVVAEADTPLHAAATPDHVALSTAWTTELADFVDGARADTEAATERLLVMRARAMQSELENFALETNVRAHVEAGDGESEVQALARALPTGVFPAAERRAIAARLVTGLSDAADALEAIDTLDDPTDRAVLDAIADAPEPTKARVDAALARVRRRRAASRKGHGTFVLEVRIGAKRGPVVAELGVIVFPPIEIQLQPYFVSLGGPSRGGGVDDLHRRFHASLVAARKGETPPPSTPAEIGYPELLSVVARVNAIYAPVGIRFWIDADTPRSFRLADDADRGALEGDDPHGWNVYLQGFNRFFPAGGLEMGRLFWDHRILSTVPFDDTWKWRDNPWFNVLMNAHIQKAQHVGRLNVWFVRRLLILGGPTAILATGLSRYAQTQKAEVLRVSDGRGMPYEIAVGDDQVGVVAAVGSLAADDPWGAIVELGQMVAHEIGHMTGLTHHLGAEHRHGRNTIHLDAWSVRSLMFNATQTEEGADPGYDRPNAIPGRHATGALLTLKAYPALEMPPRPVTDEPETDPPPRTRAQIARGIPEADVEEGPNVRLAPTASQQEVDVIREAFGGRGFFGTGL